MDIKGMMQVYSLPNLEVKGDKPDKEWFLYQKNGNSLVLSLRNTDIVLLGWEVIKPPEDSSTVLSPEVMSASESMSPIEQSPTDQSPESDEVSIKSGI
jgi:hypothetical protein